MQTIVINNKEAMVIGQLPSAAKDNKGVAIPGNVLVLFPGANVVETEKLKKLRENKAFDAHFTNTLPADAEKAGQPILKVAKELNEKVSFKDIAAKEAIVIVKETFVPALLAKWLEDEGRNDVRAALMAQQHLLATGKAASQGA